MNLEYEPASEPLHIYVSQFHLLVGGEERVGGDAARGAVFDRRPDPEHQRHKPPCGFRALG